MISAENRPAPLALAWADEPLALAAGAAVVAALLLRFAPAGTDFAAHAYQASLWAHHGFSLWNNLWYSGRYSFITYSTLYYPLAALAGIRLLAVACAGVTVLAFALVVRRRWGGAATWASRSAALVVPGFVLTAAFPFLLGATLALLSILALGSRRWWLFGVLCALAAAASPLAFLLLGLSIVGIAVGERWDRRSVAAAVALLAVVGGLVVVASVLFSASSRYPFPVMALWPALAFAVTVVVLTRRLEEARTLRFVVLLNGLACLVIFVVSSEIGEGVTRLRFVALPLILLVLALRRWRPVGVAVLAVLLAGYWNVAPLVSSFAHGSGDASDTAAYWHPATRFLREHLSPSFRVEAVDTERHWAAEYLPVAGIPLARGWFRQDDFPQNQVLYHALTPQGYLRWLRSVGAQYVVLTDATPDYSARREAALVRSPTTGLRPVFHSLHVSVFAVPDPVGIVSGPGRPRILRFGRERVRIAAPAAGIYRVAVRYSPYWRTSAGCLSRGADGMLRLRLVRGQTVTLRFAPALRSLVDVLTGRPTPACATR